MKQKQYAPLSVALTAFSLFAVDQNYLDDVAIDRVVDFEAALHDFVTSAHQAVADEINQNPTYDKEQQDKMHQVLKAFKEKWS